MLLLSSSKKILACVLFSLPNLLMAQNGNMTAQPFVVSGVIQNSNSANLLKDFSQYLAQHYGDPLQFSFASNYTELSKKIHDNPHAIGRTYGVPYVQDHDADKQQLIAAPTFKQHATDYSIILTNSMHTEKTLADFKGEQLAYTYRQSHCGYLLTKYSLFKQGINMDDTLS